MCFDPQVSSVQVSPSEVLVECHKTGLVHSIKTEIQIKGAFVSKVQIEGAKASPGYKAV